MLNVELTSRYRQGILSVFSLGLLSVFSRSSLGEAHRIKKRAKIQKIFYSCKYICKFFLLFDIFSFKHAILVIYPQKVVVQIED